MRMMTGGRKNTGGLEFQHTRRQRCFSEAVQSYSVTGGSSCHLTERWTDDAQTEDPMRPLFYLLYLLVLLAAPAAGQTLDEGGRLASLSGGGSAVDVDIWGFVNPASGIVLGSSAPGVHVSKAYRIDVRRCGDMVTSRSIQ